ncbi:sodium/proline symporter PutP [Tessaracoccus sp. MC1756]|uniref:sodium/proline symporter PutP n=1 Tax=Tessaracoccus sp. MC1756 TaxID=2760311 RepID=UPI0015FFE142|nr:sodium/proline symporter PutP [Tessaracoccus sp. MC1756]MBB1508686.1 sodium/proline symporter PutP [Tessaracoccus sp. MC1756]
MIWQLTAMALYMAGMLYIGYRATKQVEDLDDYMLGGRRLSPAVAALSAGASDMSGWLMMGLPGALYAAGLFQAWIAIGLTIGAWLNWLLVAPRLRSYTEIARNSITIPSFFQHRFRHDSPVMRVAASLIILVFFTFYVSSGMVAGGKFVESTFDQPYLLGMLIVSGVVITYTLFGGFLGATYTDVVQGILMFVALLVVPIIGLIAVGGIDEVMAGIRAVEAHDGLPRLSLSAGGTLIGGISAAAWGLGYFGQPHIIVRFMAIRSARETRVARRIGVTWMALGLLGTCATALVGIAYFNQHPNEFVSRDPEQVFLVLSSEVFHPFLAGLVLAAVLAAIMSTLSSQLVVCSSAVIEDLYKLVTKRTMTKRQEVVAGRLGVLAVSVIALLLAINDDNPAVLLLVAFAWAGFGASFGPTIILSLFWRRLTSQGALWGMVSGAVVAFVWGRTETLSSTLYEIVPGFLANLLVAVVVSLLTAPPAPEVVDEFEEAVAASKA